ncbi:helix-turn-helix domain-containing protein [Radiobacillus sp. PE A8.2]|uniref:helix-turn-helix domain-containing protein n=1 Tax=Radiobacillus sp. PE A8.2 TaxID=3380349 RepID=UPI00388E6C0B
MNYKYAIYPTDEQVNKLEHWISISVACSIILPFSISNVAIKSEKRNYRRTVM